MSEDPKPTEALIAEAEFWKLKFLVEQENRLRAEVEHAQMIARVALQDQLQYARELRDKYKLPDSPKFRLGQTGPSEFKLTVE